MKYVLKGINVIVSSSIYFIFACSSTRTKTRYGTFGLEYSIKFESVVSSPIYIFELVVSYFFGPIFFSFSDRIICWYQIEPVGDAKQQNHHHHCLVPHHFLLVRTR